jgi:hypothetical protein
VLVFSATAKYQTEVASGLVASKTKPDLGRAMAASELVVEVGTGSDAEVEAVVEAEKMVKAEETRVRVTAVMEKVDVTVQPPTTIHVPCLMAQPTTSCPRFLCLESAPTPPLTIGAAIPDIPLDKSIARSLCRLCLIADQPRQSSASTDCSQEDLLSS